MSPLPGRDRLDSSCRRSSARGRREGRPRPARPPPEDVGIRADHDGRRLVRRRATTSARPSDVAHVGGPVAEVDDPGADALEERESLARRAAIGDRCPRLTTTKRGPITSSKPFPRVRPPRRSPARRASPRGGASTPRGSRPRGAGTAGGSTPAAAKAPHRAPPRKPGRVRTRPGPSRARALDDRAVVRLAARLVWLARIRSPARPAGDERRASRRGRVRPAAPSTSPRPCAAASGAPRRPPGSSARPASTRQPRNRTRTPRDARSSRRPVSSRALGATRRRPVTRSPRAARRGAA